jgi:molecular chaperone GrpE
MKDEMKKKDEQKLEEMQQEIDEAEAAGNDVAEDEPEQAAEKEQSEPEAKAGQDEQQAADPLAEAQAQIEELKATIAQKDDEILRRRAEFENYRRRTSQEKADIGNVVTQDLIKDMLPIIDNFSRAMAAETTDMEAFQKGVEMIYTQLTEILKKDGLEPIEAEGKKFDPEYHQAVMRVANPDLEDDTIAQELQKGYMVRGKVIRPSMVQVVAND